MVQSPFSLSSDEILSALDTDYRLGLTEKEAQRRLQKYGLNQIPEQGPKSRWFILKDQLLDPIVYILSIAAVLAFFFSDKLEGFAILIVILISVGIGFFMELQAIRSLEALRKMGQAKTMVVRSGRKRVIKAAEIVVGDIIYLQTGDVIPADGRLIHVDSLSIKESALTGESTPIVKNTDTLPINTPLTDQSNMVFRGTTVLTGLGKAIITAIGKDTQLGNIQQMGVEAEKERTPLEKKLNELGKRLIWLTLFLTVIIVVLGFLRGKELLLMVETGLALAVASIPEGLPIVATIALAQGMYRLSKKQVIIKKLEAVQTLGATDIICTDKTGTLTEDQLKVHTIVFANGSVTDIYHHENSFDAKQKPALKKIILTSILCNNVDVGANDHIGDSIELALIDFAKYLGYDALAIKNEYPEYFELPFDADRKLMATAHKNNTFAVYVKGAFESLVAHCHYYLDGDERRPLHNVDAWFKKVDALAAQGMRTLAFACKETANAPTKDTILDQLIFLGLIGFLDPARKDVKATLDIYKKAGIKVVMVTGDHPSTSQRIAQEIGLLNIDASPFKTLRGCDLDFEALENENHSKKLLDATIFARVTPQQKLNLVSFYQKHNHIVGMIGDGINDVPALKKADIGIAMGIRGTEAAREVADVILKNDKFTAIELAIRQGRVVFQNIRQFVVYLLSCNLAEILSVGFAALLNLPAPLLPLQILFLNLVTDIFPALALGLGRGESDIMEQSPKNPKSPIIDRLDWYAILVYGLSISTAVMGIVAYAHFVLQLEAIMINNMAFYTLVFAQLFNVFNIPKRHESFFNNEVTKNPWVWSAIFLSLVITFSAYLILPIASVLSLKTLSVEFFTTIFLFALGSMALAQLLKRLIVGSHEN
ncbi:cation-translocating P-type ATPase [Maribacter arenosus]|uniref:Cation-transporting P-type ATPase n=1 Tax=Maribacter arenosus TaxID=1854708 RepID=A0ABR7VA92_9FLAO|nr:cation-transporting P-type ATPase [Maribacter arenosus]MBD0850206.1 cation-transporting P-type ATPase [Maribacter arenosus]